MINTVLKTSGGLITGMLIEYLWSVHMRNNNAFNRAMQTHTEQRRKKVFR